ncbi:MAG: hypothetical protein WC881_03325 [Elusimicrobiota bacterium]|jgi:hypothetical protein
MRLILALFAAILPAQFAASAAIPDAVGVAVAASPTVPEKITESYLLPRAVKKQLVASAREMGQHAAFVNMWSKILTRAGIKPGVPQFSPEGLSVLPYDAGSNLAVREFQADPMQFQPKDEADLIANLEKISGAVKQAGLPIISSYIMEIAMHAPTLDQETINVPTYDLYYLTEANDREEKEVRIRILKEYTRLDAAIMERAGVKVLQQPNPYLAVYVGPEIGLITRYPASAELAAAIARIRSNIEANGGKFIDFKAWPLEGGRLQVDAYFLR